MNKIFAYTKGAGLSKEIITRISRAGYIPVPVENMDCIRVIEPIPDADSTAIFQAAIGAIRDSNYTSVQESFGKRLANAILPKKK